jgi:hypothetical protein
MAATWAAVNRIPDNPHVAAGGQQLLRFLQAMGPDRAQMSTELVDYFDLIPLGAEVKARVDVARPDPAACGLV